MHINVYFFLNFKDQIIKFIYFWKFVIFPMRLKKKKVKVLVVGMKVITD